MKNYKLTKLRKSLILLVASGLSEWACGEIGLSNFPLAFFFGVTGFAYIAVIGIIYINER
jgi:hypothetical protein